MGIIKGIITCHYSQLSMIIPRIIMTIIKNNENYYSNNSPSVSISCNIPVATLQKVNSAKLL